MSRQAGWLAQNGLCDDCYALCLPLCLFGLGSQVDASVGRGVHFSEMFVGRVCVLESGDWGIVYCGHGFSLLWHVGYP